MVFVYASANPFQICGPMDEPDHSAFGAGSKVRGATAATGSCARQIVRRWTHMKRRRSRPTGDQMRRLEIVAANLKTGVEESLPEPNVSLRVVALSPPRDQQVAGNC